MGQVPTPAVCGSKVPWGSVTPAPDQTPFVEVGGRVEIGDPMCLIEVMKLYTTIEATVSGVVKQIAVEDTELVEFDQLLFVIVPE